MFEVISLVNSVKGEGFNGLLVFSSQLSGIGGSFWLLSLVVKRDVLNNCSFSLGCAVHDAAHKDGGWVPSSMLGFIVVMLFD